MRCGLGSTRFQFAVGSHWWVLACTRCTPVPLGGFRVTQAFAIFGLSFSILFLASLWRFSFTASISFEFCMIGSCLPRYLLSGPHSRNPDAPHGMKPLLLWRAQLHRMRLNRGFGVQFNFSNERQGKMRQWSSELRCIPPRIFRSPPFCPSPLLRLLCTVAVAPCCCSVLLLRAVARCLA